jgi:hypothetical protein
MRGLSNGASVMCLFLRRSPTAILRRIRTVIVNAVDGMMKRRLVPHIGEEILKAVAPARAHENTSRSIFSKPVVCWRVAAPSHGSPTIIFRPASAALSKITSRTVLQIVSASLAGVLDDTSTTGCRSNSQTVSPNRFGAPTITQAIPYFLAAAQAHRTTAKDDKFTESLSYQVNDLHRAIIS